MCQFLLVMNGHGKSTRFAKAPVGIIEIGTVQMRARLVGQVNSAVRVRSFEVIRQVIQIVIMQSLIFFGSYKQVICKVQPI